MCYNVKYLTQKKLHYAKRRGETPDEIKRIEIELDDLTKGLDPHYCVSGYVHPRLLVFTNKQPLKPGLFHWGLVPAWVNNEKQAAQIQNKTINARVETIFEKPSFRLPAAQQRCLIVVDGFYEFFYFNQKAFPIHIEEKNQAPLVIAGLWDVCRVKGREPYFSVTLVTTKANAFIAPIHNNPKLSEARMPLLLNRGSERIWLSNEATKEEVKLLANVDMHISLNAFPVAPIQGKNSLGNTVEATLPHDYAEFSNQYFQQFLIANR